MINVLVRINKKFIHKVNTLDFNFFIFSRMSYYRRKVVPGTHELIVSLHRHHKYDNNDSSDHEESNTHIYLCVMYMKYTYGACQLYPLYEESKTL